MTGLTNDIPQQVLGIIPARMASVRFPGKPLALARGLPMVIRVYEQARKALKEVIIATSDDEIIEAAKTFGASWVKTGASHTSGTSRCLEALGTFMQNSGQHFKAVVNIQGDEPSIRPDMISMLASEILEPGISIATLAGRETNPDGFNGPNRVKVVIGTNGNALYFSRSPIPFRRDPGAASQAWLSHIGIYAFKTEVLTQICSLEPSALEISESLEQLRWLENGFKIRCIEQEYQGFGVDTPADLEAYNRRDIF
ncbi:MAG: 3-deoxy-D-manno-octulosonate cytidylyltransferase [Bacteroidetes bacterium GWF2_49_14]|nr:MAG: 3-deoxy-D-manno-octulosonate cytidylyltransferase [Bacteroidetes bacterium GWF2_49_14]HBB93449.1 3-deoxy-manno-octulosonate cytidylyltransferase [Bacteroidales bacterium]